MLIVAKGFNYVGKGDLSKSIFDLTTHAEIDSVGFSYNHQSYFVSKKLHAYLITKINTHSLSFLFEKNDLRINQLPVEFNGKFEFLPQGYNMDFNIKSKATELKNVISAMPAEYLSWLDKTELKGTADIGVQLSGKYIAQTNTMPDLFINMGIRDGFVSNQKAPSPVTNLFLNLETKLPGLNPDSLYVNVDSVFFNIDKDYFSSVVSIKGLKEQNIHARINTEIDLEKWDRAFGFTGFDVKGKYTLHLTADGLFAKKQNPKSIRPDTVIASIPSFTLKSSFTNGYFKYASVLQPVKNIRFDINADCPDNNYQHANFSIENINANILNDYLKGFIKVVGGKEFNVNADLKSLLHLSSIKQIYPLDSMDLKGDIHLDLVTNGKYDAAKKWFPKTTATLKMQNGAVQTKYYPHPVENISIDATLTNTDGSLRSTAVNVKPISFVFEGQPFQIMLDLKNFENLKYNITSNGTVSVGNVYQVFAQKGLNVAGFIKTDLSLRGLQSDATKGLYDRLFNEGRLEVKDLKINSQYFPLPFLIKKGVFSFKQDKVWFDAFNATYGNSDFTLSGYLSNILNYTLKNEALTGNFDLKSNYIDVNQFMAFAGDSSTASETGVVIIPANLNIDFVANAKKIKYSSIQLTDAKGQMSIANGTLRLKETGFTIINAPVSMDATYTSIHPKKALFDYHIVAKDFDIHRAYNEIQLFHDLATAAASAHGIVSLDYNLKGKLDANMHPVFPSLEGGGTLSVKQVKMKGFKLFTVVSKETGRDSLNNPDVSKVDIKTKIKNNIITIDPVRMRVAGFRPKLQGQVSFDGKLNLKFRLGLPPLGIFGIPMTVTGTQDKPIIKFKRGTDNKPLQETADPDDQIKQ
jgi:AsmA protein